MTHLQCGRAAQQHVALARALEPEAVTCTSVTCRAVLAGYLTQFLPSTAMRILKRVGPGRVRAMRRGGSHYDLADMLKKE